jgi:hypothetical protein
MDIITGNETPEFETSPSLSKESPLPVSSGTEEKSPPDDQIECQIDPPFERRKKTHGFLEDLEVTSDIQNPLLDDHLTQKVLNLNKKHKREVLLKRRHSHRFRLSDGTKILTASEKRALRIKRREVLGVHSGGYEKDYQMTNEEVIGALCRFKGLVFLAAEHLGCTAGAIQKRIEANDEVRRIYREVREKLLDNSELKIYDAIESGDTELAIKHLERKGGKKRGWQQKSTIGDDESLRILLIPFKTEEKPKEIPYEEVKNLPGEGVD